MGKEISHSLQDLDSQTRSCKPKTIHFEAVLQAKEANPAITLGEYQASSESDNPV